MIFNSVSRASAVDAVCAIPRLDMAIKANKPMMQMFTKVFMIVFPLFTASLRNSFAPLPFERMKCMSAQWHRL